MPKIACFDLGFAQEDYAITNCRKYGGGAVVGRYFKQLKDFHLYAPETSFENLNEDDRIENCFAMSPSLCEALRGGALIDKVIPFLDNYDIILHGHTCFSPNRTEGFKKPIVHWSGFSGTAGHPSNHYILLYRKSFVPCFGERYKYVKIGKHVPDFEDYSDRDGVFQCTQHCKDFDSIRIAQECIKYKIRGYFAGPIRDYPLMDYIDNENTFYLGIISEKEKLLFTKKARLYTLPLYWDVVFNQSAIEANGLGTPILATPMGWFNEYIKEGHNGFFFNGNNFLDSYNKSGLIDRKDCWRSAKEYSIEEMISSFSIAFEEIVKEWKYE